MINERSVSRRRFLEAGGAAAVSSAVFAHPLLARMIEERGGAKMRVALVGTGVRGVGMFGRNLLRVHSDTVEIIGLCDVNPGRLDYAHGYIGVDCPTFTSLDQMLTTTRPEWLIVTSWDWEHHNHIIEGMRHGANIIVEKPITIDEVKAQAILDAQRQYDREIVVTHNYRYAPHRGRLKEMLMQGAIGDVTTAEFHWHIRDSHLQQYMRRWHGHRDRGGSLWVHKASHHFDLLNWWLDSDPVEVFALGSLERFGANGPFRGPNCRSCAHRDACPSFWDITTDSHLMSLYVENEHFDGYIRDNCVYRESIDIYDRHAAVIRYANGAYVNYSLTGESDYEGFWIAINGTEGRLEGREGGGPRKDHQEWVLSLKGEEQRVIRVPFEEGGHWGGDPLIMRAIFGATATPDPLQRAATSRDGILAVLVGVAARQSIASGAPVQIAGLTDLVPQAKRQVG